jgi:hypothetical protein
MMQLKGEGASSFTEVKSPAPPSPVVIQTRESQRSIPETPGKCPQRAVLKGKCQSPQLAPQHLLRSWAFAKTI